MADTVRVVDEAGTMLGVMTVDRAISTAQQKGFDLVEIAPKAKPPTCKIMDYGKWKFKMSKKEKHSRKNQIKVVIKEVQLRPRTDVHDLKIKMKKAKEFLMSGCKVKIHLRYSGREMAHKELGLTMLNKVISELKSVSVIEKDTPQMERRSAFLFFSPLPNWMKEHRKKKKQQTSQKKVTQSSTLDSKKNTSSNPTSDQSSSAQPSANTNTQKTIIQKTS